MHVYSVVCTFSMKMYDYYATLLLPTYCFPLFVLTAVSAQAYPASNNELADVKLGMVGSEPGDINAAAGSSNKRALQTSTVRSFDITVTFINSINLAKGTAVDITFDGSSGPVGTFTVYAPKPGETEFFEFCLAAAGEKSIRTSESDMDDTVLIVVRSTIFIFVLVL